MIATTQSGDNVMKPSLHEILKAERELAASRPAPRTVWQHLLVPVDFKPEQAWRTTPSFRPSVNAGKTITNTR